MVSASITLQKLVVVHDIWKIPFATNSQSSSISLLWILHVCVSEIWKHLSKLIYTDKRYTETEACLLRGLADLSEPLPVLGHYINAKIWDILLKIQFLFCLTSSSKDYLRVLFHKMKLCLLLLKLFHSRTNCAKFWIF